MNLLKDRTVLITGAARRIGRAIALGAADAGADILVHYNKSGVDAEVLCDELNKKNVDAKCIQCDLSIPGAGKKLFEKAVTVSGTIDAVVNNASIFPEQTLGGVSEASLLENLRPNTLAPYELIQALYEQGKEASVVNMLDTRILDYDRQHVPYHLSKRMLYSITKMAALQFAPVIRVNAVAPGLILPPENKNKDYVDKLAAELPMKKQGLPEDISEAVNFLLCSTFITGQIIYVDGGRHLDAQLYGG